MKVELSHPLGTVTIQTEIDTPDDLVKPVIEIESPISDFLETQLRTELSTASGHYGHIFDIEETTNLDLQSAVYGLPSFRVVRVQPVIIATKLPTGVQS